MESRNNSTSIQPSFNTKIKSLLRLCRVCLGKTDANFMSIHSVYSWSETDNRSTEAMIENLLKIKMTGEKPQPKRICSKCFNKVRLIYGFRSQCHETNHKLKEFHKKIENKVNAQQLGVGRIGKQWGTTTGIVNNSHLNVLNQTFHVERDIKEDIAIEKFPNVDTISSALDQNCSSVSTDSYDVISIKNGCDQRIKKSEGDESSLVLRKDLNVIKTPTEVNRHSEDSRQKTTSGSDPCEETRRKKQKQTTNDVVNYSTTTALCALCGLQFENSTEYIRHMRTKHEEGANEKKFKCQYCGKGFRQKAGRNLHHNLHTQEEKFICDLCGKVFLTKISIILHFKYHFGIKKHACNECGYRFVTPREVRDHIKKKHSAKSIACTYSNCTATFSSEYHLNIHLRVHDTNHAFVCDICGVATVNKYRLTEHKRIHTGVNKSKCPICAKVFARQRNVVRHIKTRHKDHKL